MDKDFPRALLMTAGAVTGGGAFTLANVFNLPSWTAILPYMMLGFSVFAFWASLKQK